MAQDIFNPAGFFGAGSSSQAGEKIKNGCEKVIYY